MRRRTVLGAIAGGGLASLGGADGASAGPIDAHVHVWSSDTARYPLAPGFDRRDLWYPSFSTQELERHCVPLGVGRANLVQMTWYGLDHSYILDAIARNPKRFVGTGIVPAVTDVAGPSPAAAMIALASRGIRGFRVRGRSTRPAIGGGPRWLDHPGYDRMFATAADHHIVLSFLMAPEDLPELDRMCARFPETPVVVDHLCLIGRAGSFVPEEIEALCRLSRNRRIMIKIGGFYALGARTPPYLDLLPLIRRVVSVFGAERCMWESDSPKQVQAPHSYQAALALIRDHAEFLSEEDKRQLLEKTAETLFFAG